MLDALLIGTSSFFAVFLGCLQAINVVNYRRFLVGLTSIAQSIAALTLFKTVPHVTTWDAACAFILGGVVGGQLSLIVGSRYKSLKERKRPR